MLTQDGQGHCEKWVENSAKDERRKRIEQTAYSIDWWLCQGANGKVRKVHSIVNHILPKDLQR